MVKHFETYLKFDEVRRDILEPIMMMSSQGRLSRQCDGWQGT